MICPECGGRREVTRRFLVFFTVRRPCPRCAPQDRDDRWTDDSWRRTDDSVPMSTAVLATSLRDQDQLEVGSGGSSGGAGGSESWTDEAPIIVDVFPTDISVTVEPDAGSDVSGTESESASSNDSSWDSDTGTSY